MGAGVSRRAAFRVQPSIYRILGKITRRSPTKVRENVWGLLLASPWIIGLIVFTAGPLLASLYFSFTDYSVGGSPKWVGLKNYAVALNLNRMLPVFQDTLPDQLSFQAIGNTLVYAAILVPIGTVGSLLLAMLLNRGLRGTYVFRTLFFMPHLVPSIATVMIWKFLMHPRLGLINTGLAQLGIEGPGWMADTQTAMISVIIIGLWGSIGGNRMLIFLAGLQGVPEELYEASELDGAGAWSRFRNVTVPMISPTILFNLILGVIHAMQVFTIAFVGTRGGPSYATWFFALHIYRQAFEYFRMGYGSALAWLFALGMLTFTWLQFRMSDRWVFYAGGR